MKAVLNTFRRILHFTPLTSRGKSILFLKIPLPMMKNIYSQTCSELQMWTN